MSSAGRRPLWPLPVLCRVTGDRAISCGLGLTLHLNGVAKSYRLCGSALICCVCMCAAVARQQGEEESEECDTFDLGERLNVGVRWGAWNRGERERERDYEEVAPRAELEGDMGDSLPGLQARLMSQALRKLTGSISKSGCMVIFINQIRMKIGVMYGSPETTTGGNALKFYSSVRLDIRRIGAIKYRDEVVGNQTRVKVVKNKVAPPFRQVEFDIMYGEGISKTGELIDLGVKAEVVEKSGSWYSYGDERIGQGRENVRTFLKDNPDIAADLERKIRINEGLIEDELLMPKDEQVEDDGEPDNVTSLGA